MALARKRELKGSYKAKLSLEKLIIEHERKKIVLQLLRAKYDKIKSELEEIGSDFCLRNTAEIKGSLPQKVYEAQSTSSASKTHLEFLFKEMNWMQEDFEREHKKKVYDAKKSVRMCRKELAERLIKKDK